MEVYIKLRKDTDELKSMKLKTVREIILCAIQYDNHTVRLT